MIICLVSGGGGDAITIGGNNNLMGDMLGSPVQNNMMNGSSACKYTFNHKHYIQV